MDLLQGGSPITAFHHCMSAAFHAYASACPLIAEAAGVTNSLPAGMFTFSPPLTGMLSATKHFLAWP